MITAQTVATAHVGVWSSSLKWVAIASTMTPKRTQEEKVENLKKIRVEKERAPVNTISACNDYSSYIF